MCWGYVRNVLGPIVQWCSVFGNPSPSILCCSQRLLPPPCSPTHMHGHTRTHKPTGTNTPPGQCVPWSLTLNRPPRLNTTDRQASGHQVHQVKRWLSEQNTAGCFHLFATFCLMGERKENNGLSVFDAFLWGWLHDHHCIFTLTYQQSVTLQNRFWTDSFFFYCHFLLWMFLEKQLDPLKHFTS